MNIDFMVVVQPTGVPTIYTPGTVHGTCTVLVGLGC